MKAILLDEFGHERLDNNGKSQHIQIHDIDDENLLTYYTYATLYCDGDTIQEFEAEIKSRGL